MLVYLMAVNSDQHQAFLKKCKSITELIEGQGQKAFFCLLFLNFHFKWTIPLKHQQQHCVLTLTTEHFQNSDRDSVNAKKQNKTGFFVPRFIFGP